MSTLLFSACHAPEPTPTPTPVAPAEASTLKPTRVAATYEGPDWRQAYDCHDMLALLQQGLEDGRLANLDDTPFTLIDGGSWSARNGWAPARSTVTSAGGEPSPFDDARCVIRIDHAVDRQSEHRVLGREKVRSRYKSGSRVEKNPAYEVAKARLRQAEKAAKPGKSSIIKVGDPLIDLVGTMLGGALTGLGQWGAGDQLEEALDTLMATPPSIEHPTYKSYQFERKRIRAKREATLPVILTDRKLGRSWTASLRRREQRDLAVVTGLDRQDEEYARHRQDNLTEDGLQRWLAEAPALPLVDIAAGLLRNPAEVPIDRLALPKDVERAEGAEAFVPPFAVDGYMDAAALPSPPASEAAKPAIAPSRPDTVDRHPATSGSLVKILGDTARADGVFVASRYVLVPSEVIGDRGLVDLEDRPGHVALGLVAALDRGLGLALVQSPMAGSPIAIADAKLGAKANPSIPSDSANAAPVLINGELAGFESSHGPDIDVAAVNLFLDRQRHLLSDDP